MLRFETIEELRAFLSDELLFTNEATQLLEITPQRLNQLVHSGKIIPIKSSKTGTLFLKRELEERKMELLGQELTSTSERMVDKMNSINNMKIIQEAINYFTIQSFFNYSDKKAEPVFDKLYSHLDLTEPLPRYFRELTRTLDCDHFILEKTYDAVIRSFETLQPTDLISKRGDDLYPKLLEKTQQAPRFLFMRGNARLAQLETVAIVGTRNPTPDGASKAEALGAKLGNYRIVVASGLAKGIDTAAHRGTLSVGNPTIAVIGTPITKVYPKENANLQKQIEEEGLVISQFSPSSPTQRWNFPMRNAVMSGISLATVVIEAGETSGALIQADFALKQDRFVFIPQSALDNEKLKWPQKYINRPGASKFSTIKELITKLEDSKVIDNEIEQEKQLSLFKEVGSKYVHRSQ
ncbi:DNA-processing protein DprA [Brevibacillus brevis]|uniref:DNA-processing protein DprA n=1 Tax=Brevibacillus brevis TaxID=1393 RepID=A0A517I0W6_BREBE|nr:DNA-processing protein DprA [Brevibacillus brevis]QDS32548.1 DNA-processing protein DprA [Brevibacillus brevis]